MTVAWLCLGCRAPMPPGTRWHETDCPACVGASRRRLALLEAAEAAGWPSITAGRLRVGPGEVSWRQAVTLADPEAVEALRGVLPATGAAPPRPDPESHTRPSGAKETP